MEKTDSDPEAAQALYADALAFKKERRLRRIHPSSTGHKHPLIASIGNTVALLCALPYYLFCALVTLPSWALSHYIVSGLKDKAFSNTARLGVNLALWPLLIIIWSIVALCALPLVPALLAILLLLPAVAFFYDYNAFALHTWSDWQWTRAKHLHARLKELVSSAVKERAVSGNDRLVPSRLCEAEKFGKLRVRERLTHEVIVYVFRVIR